MVIISAGPLTDARMRTIGGRALVTSAGLCALLLMIGCFLLGMRAASTGVGMTPSGPLSSTTAHEEQANQVIVERIGRISGRLARLEGEALALARRLGRATGTSVPGSDTDPDKHGTDAQGPSGGPYLPLANIPLAGTLDSTGSAPQARDLAEIEFAVERIEASLAELDAATADRQLAEMAFPYRLPVMGQDLDVSSGFGQRRDPFTGRRAQHTGLDIPASRGTPILASGGGRVRSAGYKGAYGYTVVIDHGDGLATLYGHASKLFVKTGDVVLPQQKIAAVGSSGRSTGPHLHFEVIRHGKRVEPTRYLASVLPAMSES